MSAEAGPRDSELRNHVSEPLAQRSGSAKLAEWPRRCRASTHRHARAGGIVGDHTSDCGPGTGRNIWAKTKLVRLKKGVQLIEHDTGADTDAALIEIKIVDLAIVTREIDNQSLTDRVSNKACPGAARGDGNIFVRGGFDQHTGLLNAGRECHAERLDLIDRSVGRVEVTSKVIKMGSAAGCADSLFDSFADH